jgi:3-oxoacyl-[acyl-carrier-protein] synthase-1
MLVDGTFEQYRMQEWQAAFVRVQNVLGRPYFIETAAQRIGYLGAAAMPILAGLAATGWEYGYGPSPIAMIAVGNDGGDRAAMVLSSVKEAGRTWAA